MEYCYSTNEEIFNHSDANDALSDAISQLTEEELVPGTVVSYFRGVPKHFKPSDFVSKYLALEVIENMQSAADDEAGESAESFTDFIPKEAISALEVIISAWADHHLSCTFYGVKDIVELKVKLTKEIIEEYS